VRRPSRKTATYHAMGIRDRMGQERSIAYYTRTELSESADLRPKSTPTVYQ